ncbi:MAG: DNA polymerase, partial [Candidatus Binatia bacterium]
LDVLQLVNDHTHIYTLKKGFSNIELFNIESFEKKYGVSAHQWVDVKALKGDSSDNIPGVGGVGEKTALELIQTYKTLDGVYEHLWELRSGLAKKLEKDKDMAYLSKKLVTLITDMPLDIDLEKCKIAGQIRPTLIPVLRKLEFRNLLREAESQLPDDELPPEETGAAQLEAAKKVAFKASDFLKDTPRVITANPGQTDMWVSVRPGVYSIVPMDEVNTKSIAALANGPLVGHDVKALFRVLLENGLEWPGEAGHDTAIGAFLLNSLQRSRQLGDLLERVIDVNDPGQVVAAIWQAYDDQHAQFDQLPKLDKLAREIEFPTIYLLAKVEHRGIRLDSKALKDMGDQFQTRIKEFEQKIHELAGQEFNIGSPAQLGVVLFEKLGLPTHGVK